MILVNKLTELEHIDPATFETLITLVAPFAPHLSEELREFTGHKESIFISGQRPKFDTSKMLASTVNLAVQVNGKVRGLLEVSPTATQDEVMALIKADDKITARLTAEPKKVIYVPGKIVNIVV
jgi:leucyl-tRNA synthetase